MEVVTLPARHRRESDGSNSGLPSRSGPARERSRSKTTQRLQRAQITASVALQAVSALMQAELELPPSSTSWARRWPDSQAHAGSRSGA